LISREHSVQDKDETILELEDDERNITISFDPEIGVKIYRLMEGENPMAIPWLAHGSESKILTPGQELLVLVRALAPEIMTRRLMKELAGAGEIRRRHPEKNIALLVPADFNRLDLPEVFTKASEEDVLLIVCPEFLNQIDQEVVRRFESVKVVRQ